MQSELQREIPFSFFTQIITVMIKQTRFPRYVEPLFRELVSSYSSFQSVNVYIQWLQMATSAVSGSC